LLLTPCDDRDALRSLVRRFLEEVSPPLEVRRQMDRARGFDPGVWKRMASELGLQGVAIPEASGGQGLGAGELAVVCMEMGRSLACAPYFASAVLAANAVACVADAPWRRELEQAIAAAEVLSLAVAESDGDWLRACAAPGTLATRATAPASPRAPWRLSGEKHVVLDGHEATRLLVAARCGDGLGLFLVDRASAGVEATPLRTFDRTRRLARVRFEAAAARPVGRPGEDAPGLAHALDRATVMLCAEMLGGLERIVETSAAHARTRRQFGQPIGTFQAVKHRCADMQIALEAARSLVDAALEACEAPGTEAALAASAACSWCGEACERAARDNVQIHGGTGFTWEHDAHLYLRRAWSSARLLGDGARHRQRIARLLQPDTATPPQAGPV